MCWQCRLWLLQLATAARGGCLPSPDVCGTGLCAGMPGTGPGVRPVHDGPGELRYAGTGRTVYAAAAMVSGNGGLGLASH